MSSYTLRVAQTSTLTILEGPDGGGKSTLAQQLASDYRATLVHSGPYKRVVKGLPRLYVEAMLPALLGLKNVVMDRAWMSEPIYAEHYRGTPSRVDAVQARMLDRVAMRCAAQLVACLPPVETCLETFRGRKGEEMLEGEEQLRKVHEHYQARLISHRLSDLPFWVFDRTRSNAAYADLRTEAHPIGSFSGGNLHAPYVLVGDTFGETKEHDPRFRVPFVSFDRSGCSYWLTEQLHEAHIAERDLLWVNSDCPFLPLVLGASERLGVFVLGTEAMKRLSERLVDFDQYDLQHFDHPQAHKRFQHRTDYPLIRALKETNQE